MYQWSQCMIVTALLFVIPECNGRIREPSCTNIEIMEQILEKNVRNEHQLSLFKEKLDEMATKLNDKLEALDRSEAERKKQLSEIIGNIDDMTDQLQDKSINMQQNIEELKTAMEAKKTEIGQVLNKELKKHETALQAFQEAYQTPTVVFTAKRTQSGDVVKGDVITFPTVVSNEGGAYDVSSGYFTAPHDGLYLFHVTVCAGYQKGLYVHLMVAGTALGSTYRYNHNASGTCTSISGMASLIEGDKAWIQGASTFNGALYGDTTHRWSSFSGILVHT